MKFYRVLIGLCLSFSVDICCHSSKIIRQTLGYERMNAGWMVSIATGFSYKNGRQLLQEEREWLLKKLKSYSQFANQEINCIKCFPMSENNFAPNQHEIGIKVTPQYIRMGMLKNINTDDFKDSTSFDHYALKVQHIVQGKKIIPMDELLEAYSHSIKKAANELKKMR